MRYRVTPCKWVSSTSSYTDVSLDTLHKRTWIHGLKGNSELTYSSEDMIQAKGSSHHPLGQLAYRIISGNTWYDSQYVLMDQKVSFLRAVLKV